MTDYSVASLIARGAFACPCGKTHAAHLKNALVGSGAIGRLAFTPGQAKNTSFIRFLCFSQISRKGALSNHPIASVLRGSLVFV